MAAVCGTTVPAQTPSRPRPAGSIRKAIPGYKLSSGDKIKVVVFGEEALSGDFAISSTGTLAFPLIGEVDARNISVTALQERIASALTNYVKAPRVSVEVTSYRPYYILGEVNKPGEYPYSAGLTVMNAVAQAQGFTYRANTRVIHVTHADDQEAAKEPLTPSTPIMPGDTITIRERWF